MLITSHCYSTTLHSIPCTSTTVDDEQLSLLPEARTTPFSNIPYHTGQIHFRDVALGESPNPLSHRRRYVSRWELEI
jgi:hypothetical protein